MKDTIRVKPRKSWSAGNLTSKEVSKFIKGELSFEDLEKLESARREAKASLKPEKGMKKKDGIKVTQIRNFDKVTTY